MANQNKKINLLASFDYDGTVSPIGSDVLDHLSSKFAKKTYDVKEIKSKIHRGNLEEDPPSHFSKIRTMAKFDPFFNKLSLRVPRHDV
jgi:hypothetical protein